MHTASNVAAKDLQRVSHSLRSSVSLGKSASRVASREEALFKTLRHYWGYETFRPGQEAIVGAIRAGRWRRR